MNIECYIAIIDLLEELKINFQYNQLTEDIDRIDEKIKLYRSLIREELLRSSTEFVDE